MAERLNTLEAKILLLEAADRAPPSENDLPMARTTATWYDELLPDAIPLTNPGTVLRKPVGAAYQDPLGNREPKAQKAKREKLVTEGQLDHPGFSDLQDPGALQVKMASQVHLGLLDPQHHQASPYHSSKGFCTRSSPQLKKKDANALKLLLMLQGAQVHFLLMHEHKAKKECYRQR
ncbi:UNVERIFIED_CONTAM: hypothetical protein K2H54_025380 [Gekko kuhli]